jgi:TolA-binding protein
VTLTLSCRKVFNALCILLTPLLLTSGLAAQNAPANMSRTELFDAADNLVSRNSFVEAIPFLEEIINRFVEDESTRSNVERPLFFLALGRIQSGDLSAAAEVFARYRELFPNGDNLPRVLNFHGDVQRALDQFDEAISTYQALMRHPTFRTDFNLRIEVLEKLTSSFVYTQQWNRGVPIFRQLLNESRDDQRKSLAASALLQAFVRLSRYNEAFELLPLLIVESPFRYDIGFNVSLLAGGDALFNEGDAVRASVFYSLTLVPAQMTDYWQRRLSALQVTLRRAEETGVAPERLGDLQNQIFNAEAQLKALEGLDDYSLDLRWRQARVFARLGRIYEAFWAFLRLYDENPGHNLSENFLFSAFTQAVQAGFEEEAVRLGDLYKSNPRFREFLDAVDVQLAALYHRLENFARFEQLALEYIRRRPAEPGAAQLAYLLGTTFIQQSRFNDMVAVFGGLEATLGSGSELLDTISYWQGMGHLFLNEFEPTFRFMDRFMEGFEFSPYREDAIFRRAITFLGRQMPVEADREFRAFLERYPNSQVRAEAQTFLGDIAASQGRIEDALAFYRQVPDNTTNMNFIDHAFFQAARLLERNRRHEDVVQWMQDYVDRFPTDGRITDALFEMGRALDALGRPEETLARYLGAIQRYGNDPFAIGVDRILEVYPSRYRQINGNLPIETFREAYEEAVRRGQRTLQYRMEWALAGMGVTVADFRLLSREDLLFASPRTLLYFGDLYKEDDMFIAQQAFRMIITRFGDSVFVPRSHLALGEIALAEGNLDQAMNEFQTIERRFPTSDIAAFAALRIGDTLLAQGLFNEAEERFQNILRTREFRGAAWAEAQFKVGMVYFEQQRYREAHGFFQRVYIAYESFTTWSSQAYLMSARALEALGERDDARNTLIELVENERFRNTPAVAEARIRLNTL